MCGIAGALSSAGSLAAVDRMVSALHHRGPDDRGIHTLRTNDREITLGSARLAIIDLSPAGHMPMHDPKTGNWITYNGEIYNFRELRRALESQGKVFRSASDTEVILNAYAQWGASCVERLRGMFAFALWDAQRQELFLARDRMGEKPLYYHQGKEGVFLFASEIRALLASGLIERRLDAVSMRAYLYNGFTVAPRTIVRGVRSLLPGYWMRVRPDGEIVETRPYWRLPHFEEASPPTLEEIRGELAHAAAMRLISDVPLGAFLSGGLDSSLIVGLMSRSAGEVRTFSIGFAEQKYDESAYARWVAERFRTSHTSITLGADEFAAWLPEGLAAMDQPTFDGLNTYFVARVARESGLTVALSGTGGDELFGGYPSFALAPQIARILSLTRRLPNGLRFLLRRAGGLYGWRKILAGLEDDLPPHRTLLAAYQISQFLFPDSVQAELWEEWPSQKNVWFGLPAEFLEFLEEGGTDADPLSFLSRCALRLFQGERVLRDGDSMSMASSLELRTVFTDHVVVEKVWRLAGKTRCQGAPHKPFEAQLAKPILGGGYPYRRKQGFIFPFQDWLRQETFQKQARETLLDDGLLSRLGLRKQGIRRILEDVSLPWSRVWALFVLLRWAHRHQAYR